MAGIRQEFVQTDFGKIHVRMSGSRRHARLPLVCLHMVPQSGQDFEAFMQIAGRDRVVVAPDYPGYGDSEPLSDNVPISIETYAKAVWQTLDVLNLKSVEILGYHTGSKVAVEMASQSPSRSAKLFCISLSSMTRETYDASEAKFEPLVNATSSRPHTDWLKTLHDYYDPELPEDILKQKYTTSVNVGSRSHLGFLASHIYNAKILEKLRRLKTPLALINPNDDLRSVTPKAADHIENSVLLERPDWLPGFLDIKPQSVLETINLASSRLDEVSLAH